MRKSLEVSHSVHSHNTSSNDTPIDTEVNDVELQCGTYDYGIRYFVAVIPAYFRLAQCIKRAKESKEKAEEHSRMSKDYRKHIDKMKHHLANAGKYLTTFLKGI